MKSIGILTFHHADNLGAVLQAYALQRALESNFQISAEIIDYRCPEIEKTRFPKIGYKGIKSILLNIYYWIKNKNFDQFRRKYLKVSPFIYTKDNVYKCNELYDCFITGSDQVWNTGCTNNDFSYFLDFVKKTKYSYAASIGNHIYSEEELTAVKKLLSEFQTISVREKTGKKYLAKIGLDNIRIDLDPVFLLNISEWKKIIPNRIEKRPYLLIYLIQEDVNVISSAESYANRNGLVIINNKKSLSFMLRNKPDDFLSWIFYSEAVFTNSFHGTALSLIFNKKLSADIELINGNINYRIYDLLNELNAQKCIISKDNYEPYQPNIQTFLDNWKNNSYKYLRNISEA